MHLLNWKPMTWSLGVFAACTFVLRIVYGLLVPKALHMTQFLEITVSGFQWLSVGAFALGLKVRRHRARRALRKRLEEICRSCAVHGYPDCPCQHGEGSKSTTR